MLLLGRGWVRIRHEQGGSNSLLSGEKMMKLLFLKEVLASISYCRLDEIFD